MPKKAHPSPKRPSRATSRKADSSVSPVTAWLRSLGALRVALLLLAVLVILWAPKPGTTQILEGRQILSTLIAPALAPIVFMVLMLDALMGKVMSGSARGAERARYRRIVAANLIAGIVLFLWWTPYFVRLFKP